jgi:autotransporter-associated beta strand protein
MAHQEIRFYWTVVDPIQKIMSVTNELSHKSPKKFCAYKGSQKKVRFQAVLIIASIRARFGRMGMHKLSGRLAGLRDNTRKARNFAACSRLRGALAISAALGANFIIPDKLFANTFVWTGTSPNAWSTPTNWNPSGPPGAADTALFNIPAAVNPQVNGDPALNVTFDTGAGAYTVGGAGGLNLAAGGLVQNDAGSANPQVFSAPVNLAGSYTFDSSAPAAGSTLSMNGQITAATGDLTLTGSNTGSNIISNLVQQNASSALSLTKSGTGSWTVAGSSNFTNGVTLSGGALTMDTGSIAGNFAITGAGGSLSAPLGKTISLDGNLIGSAPLSLPGPGTVRQTVKFSNTYGGQISLTGGTFEVDGFPILGLTISSATFDGTGGINAGVVINSNVSILSTSTLFAGFPTFSGKGIQITSGSFAYITGTIATGGDVTVHGTLEQTFSGSSLAINGTLEGDGIINTLATINSGGTISPGSNGPATLIFKKTVTAHSGSKFNFDIGATPAGPSDLIDGSAITFQAGSDVFNFSGVPELGVLYPLISCTGAFTDTGVTFVANGVAGNETAVFSTTANALDVTFVPEPATLLPGILAMQLFFLRRRRRHTNNCACERDVHFDAGLQPKLVADSG